MFLATQARSVAGWRTSSRLIGSAATALAGAVARSVLFHLFDAIS